MFCFVDDRGPVGVAFTDRAGGVSAPPFDSLNLAHNGADDPDAVAENLRRVRVAFGDEDPLLLMQQEHGRDVLVVGQDPAPIGVHLAGTADGLVTATAGLTLGVRVADCVPILLADPIRKVVGALHAGRQGLVAGIVPAGLRSLRDAGATDLVAWVGPSICGACYEVPEDLRAEVAAVVPETWSLTSWDTPALDLRAGVAAQLGREGVEVVDVALCTRGEGGLYSYRRDGARAGRLAGLVRVRR